MSHDWLGVWSRSNLPEWFSFTLDQLDLSYQHTSLFWGWGWIVGKVDRPQTENEPLDVDASKTAFEQLAKEINTSNDGEFIVG